MFIKHIQQKTGFTLIETLVAISILLIALTGPLTIAAKGLNTAYYARDQITAFYLAQEGIEYLRNIRDGEALFAESNPGGDAFPANILTSGALPIGFNKKFTIDATLPPLVNRSLNPAAIQVCPPAGCTTLKLTVGAGGVSTYGYQGLIDTQFTRDITVEQIQLYAFNPAAPYAYRLKVTVSWRSPLPNHSFTLVEDITKWHD